MTPIQIVLLCCGSLLAGCDPTPPSQKPPPAPPRATTQSRLDGHAGHGGEVIELGTATIGNLTVRASRDQGEVKAGGDVPIDVWVLTSDGKPATVAIVRFWIGAADAKGSIKAKADIENSKEPNHWHTHAEVPDPLPPDAKLWVEVEAERHVKSHASFDLKH